MGPLGLAFPVWVVCYIHKWLASQRATPVAYDFNEYHRGS
jgi:hypothetical protein